MSAATPAISVGSSVAGIDMISGSSPEFTQNLTDHVGPEAVSVLQPIQPYLVMVRNGGSDRITGLTIRWNLTDNRGQTISNTGLFEMVGTAAEPGEMVLMAPVSGLSMLMRRAKERPRLQNTEKLVEVITIKLQHYGKATAVSISLDSVIFDDNTIVGPDVAGKFGEINSERATKRQLATELLKKSPAERSAYLAAITDDSSEPAATAEDVSSQRKRIAYMLQSMIEASASEEIFRASIDYILNNQTHKLHRRNP
jgi:hypothetical protein